jgi:hypothetical protein
MKVLKAMVQLSEGADTVILLVELPNPFTCDSDIPRGPRSDANLTVHFDAPYDKGTEYVEKHFGIKPEIINRRWNKLNK